MSNHISMQLCVDKHLIQNIFNMAKQGLKPAATPLRAGKFALMVVGLSLSLQTLCQGQEPGYFDNPIMKFGKMFYVSFVNGTYDLFYECFCDIHITDCALNLTLAGSGFGFPYKYTVTNFRQTRAPDDTPLSELYRQYGSTFVCDALTHVTKGGFNCRRQKVKGNTCAARSGSCLPYKITHRSNECSFNCTLMIFIIEFKLSIKYLNFDDYPEPVKDGVCPADSLTSTNIPNMTVTNGNTNEMEKPSLEVVDVSTVETEHTDVDTATSFVNVVTGTVGAFITIVSLVVFINLFIRKKSKGKEVSQATSGSTPLSPSETTRPDSSSLETNGDETETAQYQTLDEMAILAEPVASLEECDEEGYQKIIDGNFRDLRQIGRDIKKVFRPLPKKPNPAENFMPDSLSDVSPYNSLSSPYLKVLDDQISAVPNSISTTANGHEFSNNPSRLRPHRRLVDLEDHQYLGLVNLRPNEVMFGHVTEVKLVRSKLGNLELVDSHDESPAFADYYTRIQLIEQEDNVLSVLGVLEKRSNDEDRIARPGNLKKGIEPYTHSSQPPAASDETSTTRWAEDVNPVETDQQCLEIFYFGSLELDEDINLTPCDYMTVLDIEANCKSSGGYGYLTPLDIDNIKGLHSQSMKD